MLDEYSMWVLDGFRYLNPKTKREVSKSLPYLHGALEYIGADLGIFDSDQKKISVSKAITEIERALDKLSRAEAPDYLRGSCKSALAFLKNAQKKGVEVYFTVERNNDDL